jgi:hypothetical protein
MLAVGYAQLKCSGGYEGRVSAWPWVEEMAPLGKISKPALLNTATLWRENDEELLGLNRADLALSDRAL